MLTGWPAHFSNLVLLAGACLFGIDVLLWRIWEGFEVLLHHVDVIALGCQAVFFKFSACFEVLVVIKSGRADDDGCHDCDECCFFAFSPLLAMVLGIGGGRRGGRMLF